MTKNTVLIIVLAFVIPMVIVQGLWVFRDARKRGDRFYWLWGTFCLLNIPSNLIVYLIVTRIIIDKYVNKKNN